MSLQGRYVVALVVAVLGIVLAWRALVRQDVSMGPRAIPPQPISAPGFPQEGHVRFVQSGRLTGADIASEAVRHAREAIEQLPHEHQMSSIRAAKLAELFAERLVLLVKPDFDEWIDHIQRFDAAPVWPDGRTVAITDGKYDQAFVDRWSNGASRFVNAPIALERIWVRARWISGRRVEVTIPALNLAPDIIAPYPLSRLAPEASQLDIYEFLIPAQMKSAGVSEPDNYVFVAMQFAWDKEHERWSPFRMWIYRSMSAFNGTIRLPVF